MTTPYDHLIPDGAIIVSGDDPLVYEFENRVYKMAMAEGKRKLLAKEYYATVAAGYAIGFVENSKNKLLLAFPKNDELPENWTDLIPLMRQSIRSHPWNQDSRAVKPSKLEDYRQKMMDVFKEFGRDDLVDILNMIGPAEEGVELVHTDPCPENWILDKGHFNKGPHLMEWDAAYLGKVDVSKGFFEATIELHGAKPEISNKEMFYGYAFGWTAIAFRLGRKGETERIRNILECVKMEAGMKTF